MKKETNIQLSDLFQVNTRYSRSVNLERDFYTEASLEGFVLTTAGRMTLHRIGDTLAQPMAPRAWTLTGPFGSGKSAFSLFLAKLLGNRDKADVQQARKLLKDGDAALWQAFFTGRKKLLSTPNGYLPVLVTGRREHLNCALLRGLQDSLLHTKKSAQQSSLLSRIANLLSSPESVSSLDVVGAFTDCSKYVVKKGIAEGLLVLVDELGKLLEFAAHNRGGDIFVLQELAEATKRGEDSPILLVTILHQAFGNYLEGVGKSRQEDWMKVQGRFEDISYIEPAEQTLRLVSQAMHFNGARFAQAGKRVLREAKALRLAPWLKHKDADEILLGCFPLHPLVALTVGPLFRRFAQNERSLFAFLSSSEPFGFQEFLRSTEYRENPPSLFRLHDVYDYFVSAIGGLLYAQTNSRRWTEIDSVLHRMPDATVLEVNLVKTIGILQALGESGYLKSSPDVLVFASDYADERIVRESLERLQKKSLIIYRRYSQSYGLWAGSDLDLDEELRKARGRVDPNQPLTDILTKHFAPKPLIAKRHSFEKGSIRLFDVKFASPSDLEGELTAKLTPLDGSIVFAVGLNDEDIDGIKANVKRHKERANLLVAIPQDVVGICEALFEIACLNWVKANTPALELDQLAKRELYARSAQLENAVGKWLDSLSSTGDKDGTTITECHWYHQGRRIKVRSKRELQARLSAICDEIFVKSPSLKNELINRRELSSAAASARRELIAAMLTRVGERRLGIQGYPPHLSMYFSLLENTGIHRIEGGKWGFHPPKGPDDGMKAVWNQIDDFLTETEVKRNTVSNLFETLSRPPYGIKNGVLPVVLVASLLHFDSEVAIYENGSFVPALSMPIYERLTRSPETFELQRCRIAGVRTTVFERFSEVLELRQRSGATKEFGLIEIVQGLTRFASSLPQYTRNTQTLSPTAIAIRRSLFEAREPSTLLFEQLPDACGFRAFPADFSLAPNLVDDFFKVLREGLGELQRRYDELLRHIETLLVAAFGTKGLGDSARREIENRAARLIEITVEPALKSFVLRLSNSDLDFPQWIESIATFLVNRPPELWNDSDTASFEIKLSSLRRSFLNIESLAFELEKYELQPTDREVLRLGVTSLKDIERHRVLTITDAELDIVERATDAVDRAFNDVALNGSMELRLAVLAKLSQKILESLEREETKGLTKNA